MINSGYPCPLGFQKLPAILKSSSPSLETKMAGRFCAFLVVVVVAACWLLLWSCWAFAAVCGCGLSFFLAATFYFDEMAGWSGFTDEELSRLKHESEGKENIPGAPKIKPRHSKMDQKSRRPTNNEKAQSVPRGLQKAPQPNNENDSKRVSLLTYRLTLAFTKKLYSAIIKMN